MEAQHDSAGGARRRGASVTGDGTPAPAPVIVRDPRERLEAWLMTGPAGHLWSALADLAAFAAGSLATLARERLGRGAPALGVGRRAARGR